MTEQRVAIFWLLWRELIHRLTRMDSAVQRSKTKICRYLDVGEPGVSVGKVDPARDTVEVGLGDDLDELVDAPLGVDVLDVGLVLAGDITMNFSVTKLILNSSI